MYYIYYRRGKRDESEKPRIITFKIKPDLLEEIDYIAMQGRKARSEVIREALEKYVEQYRRQNNEKI